ncbi:unnamed protein product [Rangifer tarandus platyrhynchus]|uniref:Uncharacterized protein n=1 Tax=Rangifer tarandus platyrhynchus TaxID=3082113 RepID=A0ABN9A2J7_RANTA|nr:unnamed protein product [Rangifer tarandus platyrhynchus]
MQETRVRSLVQEGPTCHGATKTHVPQLLSLCSGASEPKLLSQQALEPVVCNNRSHRNEKLQYNYRVALFTATRVKPACSNEDPAQPKINKIIIFFKRKKEKQKG